ncbi:MAG: membrane protein insertion efficiency factor YidD [Elusimicrobia bacterium]|nr:membrane protein insertion efficiency factor YidD [Elusimicrobiota bacterium]
MKKLLILFIKLWQKIPKTPHCRFYPSCSQYFIIAVEKYGLFQGSLKGIWRILRCHPFSKGGFDLP